MNVEIEQRDFRETLARCHDMGTVCDPFTGSGTTALAAVRSFVGGDKYADESGVPWATVAKGVRPLLEIQRPVRLA